MSKPTPDRIREWLTNAEHDARILRKEAPLPRDVSRWDVEGTFRVNLVCLVHNGHEKEAQCLAATVPGFLLRP